jgi:hypothetical protein
MTRCDDGDDVQENEVAIKIVIEKIVMKNLQADFDTRYGEVNVFLW